jgi:hypothetical protein
LVSSFPYRTSGWFDFARDFGAVSDGTPGSAGGTDNSVAWNKFSIAARAASDVGGVVLTIPKSPSGTCYSYNLNLCYTALWLIPKLKIIGWGAVLQNTNSSVYNSFFVQSIPDFNNPTPGNAVLINSTSVGDTSVTIPGSDVHTQFTVGKWAMVTSLDIQQTASYPPNCHQFDYVIVTNSIFSGGNTVVSFDRPLRYNHLSTFPDYPGTYFCGAARITGLYRAGAPTGYVANTGFDWELEHEYEGLVIPHTVGLTQLGAAATMTGRSITWRHCTLPSISPSVTKITRFEDCTIGDAVNFDKLNECVIFDGGETQGSSTPSSSSNDIVIYRNHRLAGGVQSSSKLTSIDGCIVDSLYWPPGTYGVSSGTSVRDSTIRNMRKFPFVGNQNIASPQTVDGTNIIYNAGGTNVGVFKILKAGTAIGVTGGFIPGVVIAWAFPSFGLAGLPSNIGAGVITSVTGDSTYIYITTTLKDTAPPAWCTANQFVAVRVGRIYVENSTGCDNARSASQACATGNRPWAYQRWFMAGQSGGPGNSDEAFGILTSATINVIQAGPGGSSLSLSAPVLAVDASTMTNAQSYSINIDLTVTGIRTFTLTALSGKTTNDSVLVAGAGQTALPNKFLTDGIIPSVSGYTPGSTPVYQCPLVDITLVFDTGILDQVMNTLVTVSGSLP